MRKCLIVLLVLSVYSGCGGGGSANVPQALTIKIVRPDGIKLDTSAVPIPLGSTIEVTFPIAESAASIESEMIFSKGGISVAETCTWNSASTVMLIVPTETLEYASSYNLRIPSQSIDVSFITMTKSDVNGDGVSDVIIDASLAGTSGEVYLFSGSALSGNKAISDVLATISGGSGDTISRIAILGDVNGDGYADIGAISPRSKKAYIFSGAAMTGAISASSALANIDMSSIDTLFMGQDVAGLGDINGDRYDDIAVAVETSSIKGTVYIFSGLGLTGDLTLSNAYSTITGPSIGDGFGVSLSGGCDFNDDGYGDLLIGAYASDEIATSSGSAYVFSGASINGTLNSTDAVLTILGDAASDLFGWSVSFVGDANGDGCCDFVVGAMNSDIGAIGGGAMYFFNSKGLSGIVSASSAAGDGIMWGNSTSDFAGYAVSGTGDVNRDGYADIMLGAIGDDDQTGAVHIISGAVISEKSTGDLVIASIFGLNTKSYLGFAISGVGDINSDGVPDIIIGEPTTLEAPSIAGSAYVFSGASLSGQMMTSSAYSTIVGSQAGDDLGGDVFGQQY